MTLEEMREILERGCAEAEKNIARWQTALEVAKAALMAHDDAVEAARRELRQADDHPSRATPLNGRASRRNIAEVVYETLVPGGVPMTTDELVEAIDDVRHKQVQAALLKLGDKVTTKPVMRLRAGYSTEVPGYIRVEENA